MSPTHLLLVLSLIVRTIVALDFKTFRCGQRPEVNRLVGRVVGGKSAFYGQAPWTGMLRESTLMGLVDYRKCGAVLISDKWAITAAHCAGGWFRSLMLVLGQHNVATDRRPNAKREERVQARQVKRFIVHPEFDNVYYTNDIALIELDRPVTFNSNVQPICLPQPNDQVENLLGYVAGWGKKAYNDTDMPDVLQVARLPILTNRECRRMYRRAGHRKKIGPNVICAGLKAGGVDSCEGDSGGPLFAFDVKRKAWFLVGIVSNGIRCAEPNLPGVYSRISHFLPWLAANTGQSFS